LKNLVVILLTLICGVTQASTIEEAWELQRNGNVKAAIAAYEPFAQQDSVRALTELGILYESKEINDLPKAFYYYKRAADLGGLWATYNVGSIAAEGKLGLTDYDTAEEYTGRAAKQGLLLAMTRLTMLFQGPLYKRDLDNNIKRYWAISAYQHGNFLTAHDVSMMSMNKPVEAKAWLLAYILAGEKKIPMESMRRNLRYDNELQKQQVEKEAQAIYRTFNSLTPAPPFPWRK